MGNSAVIVDSPEPSDTWILHTKVQQSVEDPFRSTMQVIDFLEFHATIGNLLTDILLNYLPIGKTSCTLDKLRMHPGAERDGYLKAG